MTMNNSNIEFYVTYGKKALTSERANGTLALDGTDPENVQYRKDVFPGYTNFLREVFKARYTGEITEEEKITIFSQVKDFAIERIYAYRHKMGVVAQAEVVVEETISEVEALRAQVAQLQADVAAKDNVISNLENQVRLVAKGILSSVAKAIINNTTK
jgi:hypothetical protein